ncbi:hypothetical protein EYR41_006486 [Orbilia oligospora]|uniref:Uncharacterized protein n=1 Tax=Orbilia oligospora TaxID=2813651 RepID=A0A8H2HQ84_ORBOL|nr:hypothetical protein TWF217_008360 [Orbilia oligospora]TGJ67353.1 hypothetical protein EYR41_006486 [Orbilia oligospora]
MWMHGGIDLDLAVFSLAYQSRRTGLFSVEVHGRPGSFPGCSLGFFGFTPRRIQGKRATFLQCQSYIRYPASSCRQPKRPFWQRHKGEDLPPSARMTCLYP